MNIKKIGKNLYKELESTFNKKIDENSKLEPIPNEKIDKNSYEELRSTPAKKIGKSLNKKLKPSFVHNNIHLKKESAMVIIKTNSKIYKLKIYHKVIGDLIYSTK